MTQGEFLKKSFELGTYSHAYIFFGNDEQGKKKTLEELFAFLAIAPSDMSFVKPDGAEITIAKIRELHAFLSLSAWSSPYKIAVIENAEKANQEAQSALLKLLEEPKGNAIFFLLTEYPFLLLSTLRSRVQSVGFWKFGSLESSMKKEFEKLELQNLEARFEYAKALSEDEDASIIQTVLTEFLKYLRNSVLGALRQPSENLSKKIEALRSTQEIVHLLQTTNVNKRLAIEQLMLEFS